MDLGSYVRDECIGTSGCPSKFCPLRFVVESGESCGAADKKPPYNIGVSASSEKKELLAAQVELRSDVVNLLSTRRELLRKIDGVKVHETQAVSAKTIKFLKRIRNNILVEEIVSIS